MVRRRQRDEDVMGVLKAALRGAKKAGRRKRRTPLEIIADILSVAGEGGARQDGDHL